MRQFVHLDVQMSDVQQEEDSLLCLADLNVSCVLITPADQPQAGVPDLFFLTEICSSCRPGSSARPGGEPPA